MRRIRVLFILGALTCALLGGASPGTASAAGSAVRAVSPTVHGSVQGKRWY